MWCFFCASVLLFGFVVCFCKTALSVSCCPVVTCWERADFLGLLCVMFICVYVAFAYGVQGWVWYLIA